MASVDAKETKAVSTKQLQANRRNAGKSTGPRTDDGKARASGNAVTHGVFSQALLLPGEDAAELTELRRGIYLSQSPQDVMECELVDGIVDAQWRLRRLRGSERAVLANERDVPRICQTSSQRRLARAVRVAEAAGVYPPPGARERDAEEDARYAEAEAQFRSVAGDDEAPLPPPGAALLASDFHHAGSGTIERLSRYQQRLEQSVHRALRELRQLRKDRAEREAEEERCPYLEELDPPAEAGSPREDVDQSSASEVVVADGSSRAETCGNVRASSKVKNEPISRQMDAAPVAAEGCAPPSRAVRRCRPGGSGISLPGEDGWEVGVI